MATGGESSSSAVAGDQFAQIMDAIKASQDRLDSKLAEFRSEVRQGQEQAAATALKRARQDKPYAFKKKSNEEQARVNSRIDETLAEAQAELDDHTSAAGPSATVSRAQDAIARGRKAIAERQKLIRIADRSEYGWAVVEEYTADELADDSDDEKRLEKAEKAAERKIAKRRKRADPAGAASGRPFKRRMAMQTVPPATTVRPPSPMTPQLVRPAAVTPTTPRAIGPCFACGQMGHLRSYCPKAQRGGKNWYPPLNDRVGTIVGGGSVDEMEVCVHGFDGEGVESVDTEWDVDKVGCLWEIEVGPEPTPLVCVKGRLRESLTFWREELKASKFLLETIESGYVLPLKSMPPPFIQQNQASVMLHAEFVQQSIVELLANRCVKRVPAAPHVCSPLSVVVSGSGKKRLVINLRHVNRHLWKQKFKYEDLRVAMLLLERGDYMFSFDLKSGYHHVDIAEVHHKYLGFAWEGEFYVFTVLPFGLSTACYIFTKLMRPLVRYWRARGVRIVLYLDDGLGAASGSQATTEASKLVQTTLGQAGFVTHPSKSKWEAVQRLSWLGFVIDTELGQIEIPQEKLQCLKGMIQQTLQAGKVQARLLASVVGKIISMGLAFGPVSRFMTRSLYAVLESRTAWCERLVLSEVARAELRFWELSMDGCNSQPIWRSPSAMRVVYSDASDTGYGGYVIEHGPCTAYGQWSEQEAKQSSTWRELMAVYRVLLSVANKLHNTRVRWFTDNQNVARILEVGSRQGHLQEIALKVFSLAVHYHIHLEPEWIPRELNQQADYLSRIIEYDDWQLNPIMFAELDALWGPHTVDRFASFNNCQLPRFNSRSWNPGSEAVDAFTVHWAGENNWWCPPIALIPRVIRHAQVCGAEGTLVVPCWPSAPFWPMLCPAGSQFAEFVVEVCELPHIDSLFLPGLSGAVLFKGGEPNTTVYALRCRF